LGKAEASSKIDLEHIDFMKKHLRSTHVAAPGIAALMAACLTGVPAMAQMDLGPKTERTYGIGLPRDHASQLFKDEDYPVFALKPGQEAYQDIDGARMKKDVIAQEVAAKTKLAAGGPNGRVSTIVASGEADIGLQ
jgi:hypothetical protein